MEDLLGPTRGYDRTWLSALPTGLVPGFFIEIFWHFESNRILFQTMGAGESDHIPGPCPNNRGFCRVYHDISLSR